MKDVCIHKTATGAIGEHPATVSDSDPHVLLYCLQCNARTRIAMHGYSREQMEVYTAVFIGFFGCPCETGKVAAEIRNPQPSF